MSVPPESRSRSPVRISAVVTASAAAIPPSPSSSCRLQAIGTCTASAASESHGSPRALPVTNRRGNVVEIPIDTTIHGVR